MSGQSIAHSLRLIASTGCTLVAITWLDLGAIGFFLGIAGVSGTQAFAQTSCRPTLALNDVQFSEMRPPTLKRRWTAVVSVDASHCATNSSGSFDLVFKRMKEIGLDLEFRERFAWRPPSVEVGVDFWADEAVERYWIDNVTPCSCRD
jgi:hypothetical protein